LPFLINITDDHAPSLFQEAAGDGFSDSSCGSGYQEEAFRNSSHKGSDENLSTIYRHDLSGYIV
jgi:hypothetical protein